LFGAMVVALLVFRDSRGYMLLWMYGMVGIIAWVWKCVCGREGQWRGLIHSPKRAYLA